MVVKRGWRTVLSAVLVLLVCAGLAAGSSSPDAHLEAISADRLQVRGLDGTGTTVAVIDSGVAAVPGLDDTLIHQENISGGSATGDEYGHGTFVAGLVHQAAPGAQLVSVKLSGADGSVDVTQVLAALQWVVLNRDRFSIDVVNLSFGSDSRQSTRTSPLNYAVQKAWDAGIVVVVSAGNLGDEPGTITKPADDPFAISVGATDDHETAGTSDDDIPAFVSRGPTVDGLAKPDLTAPGAHVESLRAPGSTVDTENPQARVGTDGFRGSGTSFSAPLVAGVAAQLLGATPDLSPDEVKYALIESARPVSGDTDAQGAGSIDAVRAWRATRGHANAGAQRGDGSGSLDGDRGSAHVDVVGISTQPDGGLVSTTLGVLGEETAMVVGGGSLELPGLQDFDRQEYLDPASWDASRWGASRWGETQWGASRWGASRWGASRWGSSEWWASRWG